MCRDVSEYGRRASKGGGGGTACSARRGLAVRSGDIIGRNTLVSRILTIFLLKPFKFEKNALVKWIWASNIHIASTKTFHQDALFTLD